MDNNCKSSVEQEDPTAMSFTHLESLCDHMYSPLRDPTRDIRLLELLPGQLQDEIRIRIRHTTLVGPVPLEDDRISILELRKTMPRGWQVDKVLGGRYVFSREADGDWHTHWKHPDADFDASRYEPRALCHADFPEVQYEALSYVWGSAKKTESIVVLSSPERQASVAASKLAVTANLKEALLHLREAQHPRILWVDSICFNQNDNEEVRKQIPRMRDIYRSAYRVVVWLGPEQDDTGLAISSLRYLAQQVEVSEIGNSLLKSPDAVESTWWRSELKLPWDSHIWRAVFEILGSPWFTRLWVTQEVQLARKQPVAMLNCGSHSLDFLHFQKAVCRLWYGSETDVARSKLLEPAWAQLQPQSIATLRTLVRRAGFRDCLDPRDRLYGILGLTSKRFSGGIEVSYEKSVADVYKEGLLAHARLSGRLELFGHCQVHAENSKLASAPSWVPDWSRRDGQASVPVYDQYAAGSSRAHVRHSDNKRNTLQVLGLRSGVVSHTTKPLTPDLDVWDAARHVRTWQPDDLATAQYGPTGEPKRKAYVIALIQGGSRDLHPGHRLWISLQDWKKQEWQQALSGVRALHNESIAGSISTQDVAMALQGCYGRMYFETTEGYIGQGPFNTQKGDIIAVFLGCTNPLVLRLSADTEDKNCPKFSIIGECFVHGMQDSTKLLGPVPHQWRSVENFSGSRSYLEFVNSETGEVTQEDPRLEPLDDRWERIWLELDRDNQHEPNDYCWFRNKANGKVINYDQRLEPGNLEARGVRLVWFDLV